MNKKFNGYVPNLLPVPLSTTSCMERDSAIARERCKLRAPAWTPSVGASPYDPRAFQSAPQSGATGFFAHVDFSLTDNADDDADFSATLFVNSIQL